MHVTCPRCLRTLSTADPNGPPVFCMYCGQKLRDADTGISPPPVEMKTTSFVPFGPDPDEPTINEPVPKEIGGYRLHRLLGSGGMGSVYEAETPDGGHRVAVKLLSSRLSSNPSSVERFKQEGRLASQLMHPRCVFVLAADTDAGRPYIVMELMPGRTLRDLVDEGGPLASERAITYMLDVIDGLAEAHRLGVLHRDIKPSNCFLTADDRVKVGDFGLSKSLSGDTDQHLTQTGAFLGTVLFASPEQIRGEPLDYASDVYSVCATLYYLLCGEAPYQHESVTAALARAISEPPPSIRKQRPDVSPALEKTVMWGLERERGRRWPSLEDLREALAGLLPSRMTPARPRVLMGAYLLDRVLASFIAVPAELIRRSLAGQAEQRPEFLEFRWAEVLVFIAYFTIGEGLFGATPAKWLLGLRVSRVGRTDPPGLWAAFIRSVTFTALLFVVVGAPALLGFSIGGASGELIGLGVFILGLAAMLLQLRRTEHGYRGVHDLLSGCHVTKRPLPARKLRLVPKRPSPMETVVPEPADAIPGVVGGFAIRGRVWNGEDGEQVWSAEDKALCRKVLLWLRAEQFSPVAGQPKEAARPTRLRRLGTGKLRLAETDYDWTAFAAPVGSPLLDTIVPEQPLPWADARYLLEQLVDEFRAAERDGTMPERLSLEQVWVEPNGRVQVLDVPFSSAEGFPKPGQPPWLCVLRQVASLTLEGRARSSEGPIHAPVPPHAAPVLSKLCAAEGYSTIADLQKDLTETCAHTPEVTAAVRTAQLGIQAAVLAFGLAAMFLAAAVPAVVFAKLAELRADQAALVLAAVRDDEARAELAGRSEFEAAFRDPERTERRIEQLVERKRHEAQTRRADLFGFQKFALKNVEAGIKDDSPDKADARTLREVLTWAAADEHSPLGRSQAPWKLEAAPIWIVLGIVPLGWMLMAILLRGSVSMLLTGITIVRGDGRRATRRQCAFRAMAVWLPITALLAGSVWLQVYHPTWALSYLALWLLAAILLPVYVAIALWNPDRPPQDRLVGTYLVPV